MGGIALEDHALGAGVAGLGSPDQELIIGGLKEEELSLFALLRRPPKRALHHRSLKVSAAGRIGSRGEAQRQLRASPRSLGSTMWSESAS